MPATKNTVVSKGSRPVSQTLAAAKRQAAKRDAARGPGKVPLSSSSARATRSSQRGRRTRVSEPAELRGVAESVRSSDTNTLVLVYSPMCGHCVRMRPAFDTAARALVGQGVQVVEIESSVMSGSRDGNPLVHALGDGYVGVPHIVLFGPRASWKRPYDGDRSAESLASFGRA